MLCHSMLKDLDYVPKLTKRPKKTSNNLKLDTLGGEEKKYLVLTLQELLKLNWTNSNKDKIYSHHLLYPNIYKIKHILWN